MPQERRQQWNENVFHHVIARSVSDEAISKATCVIKRLPRLRLAMTGWSNFPDSGFRGCLSKIVMEVL